VDDPEAVCGVEGIGDLAPVLEGERVRQRSSCEPLRQRLSFEKLHHQEVRSVLTSDVVESADVRMVQPRDGPRLPVQPLTPVLFSGKFGGKDLDGDGALEPGVPGFVDLAHSTCPDGGEDLVGSQASPRPKGHREDLLRRENLRETLWRFNAIEWY